jgi:hypothetical protein
MNIGRALALRLGVILLHRDISQLGDSREDSARNGLTHPIPQYRETVDSNPTAVACEAEEEGEDRLYARSAVNACTDVLASVNGMGENRAGRTLNITSACSNQ